MNFCLYLEDVRTQGRPLEGQHRFDPASFDVEYGEDELHLHGIHAHKVGHGPRAGGRRPVHLEQGAVRGAAVPRERIRRDRGQAEHRDQDLGHAIEREIAGNEQAKQTLRRRVDHDGGEPGEGRPVEEDLLLVLVVGELGQFGGGRVLQLRAEGRRRSVRPEGATAVESREKNIVAELCVE